MRLAVGKKKSRDASGESRGGERVITWVDAAKRFGGVRVRWLGLTWAGVPWPVRWGMLWGTGVNVRKLEGCGCSVPLKAWWLKVRRMARRLLRDCWA